MPARLAVQLLFLALVVWIGVDFARWVGHHESLGAAPYVQRPAGVEGFLPIAALMSVKYFVHTGVVHPVHPAGFVLLLAFVGVSLIAKKAFCSWVCPVGLISEWLGRFGNWGLGKNLRLPRWLDVSLRGLKYLLLAFFLWAILKMPAIAIEQFLDSPYAKVADVKMLHFFRHLTPFALGVLLALFVLSTIIRNFWCRYLCPYGALLGLTSLLAPWKITRHAEACIDCERCDRACPSSLPVMTSTRVRSDECVGCMECVRVCPRPAALGLELPKAVPAPYRRLSPARAAALVLALTLMPIAAAKVAGMWAGSVSEGEYRFRIQEINSPLYNHARGSAPSDTREIRPEAPR